MMSCREIAKVGQLILNRGKWLDENNAPYQVLLARAWLTLHTCTRASRRSPSVRHAPCRNLRCHMLMVGACNPML